MVQEVARPTMGCDTAPKQATQVVPDVLYAPVLLPVPGRSRASLLPRPAARIKSRIVYNLSVMHQSQEDHSARFCPEGIGVSGGYDGYSVLRSGPKTGYPGCA